MRSSCRSSIHRRFLNSMYADRQEARPECMRWHARSDECSSLTDRLRFSALCSPLARGSPEPLP